MKMKLEYNEINQNGFNALHLALMQLSKQELSKIKNKEDFDQHLGAVWKIISFLLFHKNIGKQV